MPQNVNPSLGQELLNFIWKELANPNLHPAKFAYIMNFFGISRPFAEFKYKKVMEFAVEKRSQGRLNDKWYQKLAKKTSHRWQKRWLVIGFNNLFYYKYAEDAPDTIRDSIPFDTETRFNVLEFNPEGCVAEFKMHRRTLEVEITDGMNGLFAIYYVIKAFRFSYYTKPHRFTSFAPIRENNNCKFFIDGKGYFEEVFKAFETARSDILITDWWMSPEMPLIRPIQGSIDTEYSRLDFTLKRACDRGVSVYIILYKEFFALGNDSGHAKDVLEALSPNIKVLRHPNVLISLWSHHEKLIVVDKFTVFLGGLDLCWGRFDGNSHPLFNDKETKTFPGLDYYNPLKKEISNSKKPEKSFIDQDYPRMPWHDVAVMITGAIANDYVNHFIAYWNHARETNHESEVLFNKKIGMGVAPVQSYGFQNSMSKSRSSNLIGTVADDIDPYEINDDIHPDEVQNSINNKLVGNDEDGDQDIFSQSKVELHEAIKVGHRNGKGALNVKFVGALRSELDKQLQASRQLNRQEVQYEATLDQIYQSVRGVDPVYQAIEALAPLGKDTLQGLGNIINMVANNAEDNDDQFQPNYVNPGANLAATSKSIGQFGFYDLSNASIGPQGIIPQPMPSLNVAVHDPIQDNYERLQNAAPAMEYSSLVGGLIIFQNDDEVATGPMKMQALRSASPWSLGKKKTEASIYQAYLQCIESAERFIYIENQFFISKVEDGDIGPENRIARALFARIKRAYEQRQPFRVIIFIPLLPAFEASLEDQKGAVMQISIGLHQASIGRGHQSLMSKLNGLLQGSNITPEHYVMACSLRKFDKRPSDHKPITELIYIHSKVV